MSTYQLLLFGHLLSVVVWVGGTACIQVLSVRAKIAGPERLAAFAADAEWIGRRLLAPASVLVITFGLLLVNEIGYDLSDTWLVLALVGFSLSFLMGAIYLDPESGRISDLAARRGAADPEVRRRIRSVMLVSNVDLAILIAVILDMVAKPGL
jgi:uncharacterized membrane protein